MLLVGNLKKLLHVKSLLARLVKNNNFHLYTLTRKARVRPPSLIAEHLPYAKKKKKIQKLYLKSYILRMIIIFYFHFIDLMYI